MVLSIIDGKLLLSKGVLQEYNVALYPENIRQLNGILCISLA